MTQQIPRAVVTGRRVAMALLVTAMVLTALGALWLFADWFTRPAVV
jgi:hypothetical protein